jgi:formylglycine-generating enzyme required for sulfatase activity
MELVLIPAGEFTMGCPDWRRGEVQDEGPPHRVVFTKPFYMGRYEVTRGQFARFVEDTGYVTEAEKGEACVEPSSWRGGGALQQDDRHPVVMVSWEDAVAFCRWLSGKSGRDVRLPTEAEWEYACRAGSATRFCFGDSADGLGEYAWYEDNSGEGEYPVHPVGEKRANSWGLHDMHGNVYEWCADRYGPYPGGTADKTARLSRPPWRVLRGGDATRTPEYCRSANRWNLGQDFLGPLWGFRVCVGAAETAEETDSVSDRPSTTQGNPSPQEGGDEQVDSCLH